MMSPRSRKVAIALAVAIIAVIAVTGAGDGIAARDKNEGGAIKAPTEQRVAVTRETALLSQRLRGPDHWDRLDIAATRDSVLLEELRALIVESRTESAQALRERVKYIVLRWAGAHEADPTGRGPAIDGRHLAAVEAWRGKTLPRSGERGNDPTPVQAVEFEGEFQNIVDWAARTLLRTVVEVEEWLKAEEEGRTIASEGRMWSHRLVLAGLILDNLRDMPKKNHKASVRDAVWYVRLVREHTPETAITLDEVKLILRLRYGGLEEPNLRYARPVLTEYGLDDVATARAIEWITTPYASRVEGTDGRDRLEGGPWNDILSGGDGDDTYVWGPGRGNDVVSERKKGGGHDEVAIQGVRAEEVEVRSFERPGHEHDRQIGIKPSGEWIMLYEQARPGAQKIEAVTFDDGTVWTSEEIEKRTVRRPQY